MPDGDASVASRSFQTSVALPGPVTPSAGPEMAVRRRILPTSASSQERRTSDALTTPEISTWPTPVQPDSKLYWIGPISSARSALLISILMPEDKGVPSSSTKSPCHQKSGLRFTFSDCSREPQVAVRRLTSRMVDSLVISAIIFVSVVDHDPSVRCPLRVENRFLSLHAKSKFSLCERRSPRP
jgi:hypothetical protein